MNEIADTDFRLKAESINIEDVAKIAMGLKSLATYAMLAYEHEDDPEDLQEVVDEGLKAIDRLFES